MNVTFTNLPRPDGMRELEVRCANLFQRAAFGPEVQYGDIARWENWATKQVFWIANHFPNAIGAFEHPAILPKLADLCRMGEQLAPASRLLGHTILLLDHHPYLAIRIANLPLGRQLLATQWGEEVVAMVYPYSGDLDVCW